MTGRLAAPASSSRRTGVVYGALRAVSGSSAASARISPDRLGEGVERLAGLRLRRLHQQRLLHQQREVDRRRVVAVVEQPLGEVERADAQRALHRPAGEHELVHADAVVGGREMLAGRLAQPRQQVVGVQHGGLRRLLQPVAAEGEDVGVGAHEDAVVALEAAQAADRLRPVEVEVEERPSPFAALAPHDLRPRQVGLDALRDGDRPRARPAAAVRLGERLVEVEVDDVEAHVAGPRAAHDGVEVRAVVVERRARVVHDVGDLLDRRVEQPERVRVGEHEAGDVVARLRLAGPRRPPRRSAFVPTLTTSKPAIVTVAGFVPCAVSGVSTFVRRSPRSSW